MASLQSSEFRVEKQRSDAVIILTNGTSVAGHFFLAQASPTSTGRERVGELLNAESGFFPFEDEDGDTVLYNRDHVVTVEVFDDEARRDAGYGVATERIVSLSLSNGQQLRGTGPGLSTGRTRSSQRLGPPRTALPLSRNDLLDVSRQRGPHCRRA